jgi:hypothetical protein
MMDPTGDDRSIESQSEYPGDAEDDYERAMKEALALMEKGFDLGGTHKLDRDALHDRKASRDKDSR